VRVFVVPVFKVPGSTIYFIPAEINCIRGDSIFTTLTEINSGLVIRAPGGLYGSYYARGAPNGFQTSFIAYTCISCRAVGFEVFGSVFLSTEIVKIVSPLIQFLSSEMKQIRNW
jgi:hypothetical protein